MVKYAMQTLNTWIPTNAIPPKGQPGMNPPSRFYSRPSRMMEVVFSFQVADALLRKDPHLHGSQAPLKKVVVRVSG
jgi:hypothetical protein